MLSVVRTRDWNTASGEMALVMRFAESVTRASPVRFVHARSSRRSRTRAALLVGPGAVPLGGIAPRISDSNQPHSVAVVLDLRRASQAPCNSMPLWVTV